MLSVSLLDVELMDVGIMNVLDGCGLNVGILDVGAQAARSCWT
jgi:hypothetical protein